MANRLRFSIMFNVSIDSLKIYLVLIEYLKVLDKHILFLKCREETLTRDLTTTKYMVLMLEGVKIPTGT